MKRVKRNRAPVSYYEPEEPSFDEYIFCSSCGDYVYEYCAIHGPLLVIPDDEVPTPTGLPALVPRAALTIPRDFLHLAPSTIPGAGIGVFSSRTLPSNVRFGPFRGLKTDEASSPYCWQIFDKSNKPLHVLDARDPNKSNWMRYVNCSRHRAEQSLVAFQYQAQLYYRTIRIVPRFTELLVFYGGECARELNIDLHSYHSPVYMEIRVKCEPENDKYEKKANSQPVQSEAAMDVQLNALHSKTLSIKQEITDENEYEHVKQEKNIDCEHIKQEIKYEIGVTNIKQELPCEVELEPIQTTQLELNAFNAGNAHMRSFSYDFMPTGSECVQEKEDCSVGENSPISDICNNLYGRHFGQTRGNNRNISYVCDDCGQTFNNKVSLIAHIKVHRVLRYTCPICAKKFDSKSSFLHHNIEVHNYQMPYKACTLCNYKTVQNSHFREHMDRHSGIFRYKCDICDYASVTNNQLQRHIKFHLTRPFSCKVCGSKFINKSSLGSHMIVHSDERPCACSICGNRFKMNKDLRKHIAATHEEKPYTCQICKKHFGSMYKLNRHAKTHTGERPFQCSECLSCFSEKHKLKRHERALHGRLHDKN